MRKLSVLLAILLTFCMALSILPLEEASAQASPTLSPPALYAGTSGPGLVYQYLGDDDWRIIGNMTEFDNDVYAVADLVEYQGQLWAGVTTGYGGTTGVGRVYVRDGDTSWTCVGNNMDHAVISLAVYKGNLYAGTGRGAFRLYKYTPGETDCGIQNWTRVVNTSWDGVRSLYVSYNSSQYLLLMGDAYYDRIAHWDGENFTEDRTNNDGSCIYDFADFGDYVYASAYAGRLFKSSDRKNWQVQLGYYDGPMWELERVQDKLYMAYDSGELRWWNGSGSARGTQIDVDPSTAGINPAPDGIISMATDGSNLYFGTGGDAIGYPYTIGGIANIYKYDGTSTELISDHDQFGEGVQVLYSPEKLVVGYMWQDLNALEGKNLTHVIESFAWVDSRSKKTGYLKIAGLNQKDFVKAAKENNMIPLVSIQQAEGDNNWATVISDDTKRGTLISSIVDLVIKGEYMGVDIDLEALASTDVGPYRQFVSQLREALDNNDTTSQPRRLLTIAVQGTYIPRYSIADLTPAADYIMLMGYDNHLGVPEKPWANEMPLGPWENDPNQPDRTRQDPSLCIRRYLMKIVGYGYPAERVVYLLPFYARWGQGSKDVKLWNQLTETQRQFIATNATNEYCLEKRLVLTITPKANQKKTVDAIMWWTDPECIREKTQRALFANNITLPDGRGVNIGGVGAWQIEQDASDSQLTTALWNAAHGL